MLTFDLLTERSVCGFLFRLSFEYKVRGLTLSLPIFWQFYSLSATFMLTEMNIEESQAYKFSKILFFYVFFQLRLKIS